MNSNDQQIVNEQQYPTTSKYDYEGITGTWLLIPAKFHILLLAILLPIILWVLPNVSFNGEFRFIFADYKYYFAGIVVIFFLSSAFLSSLKAKQVSAMKNAQKNTPKVTSKPGPGIPKSRIPQSNERENPVSQNGAVSVKVKKTSGVMPNARTQAPKPTVPKKNNHEKSSDTKKSAPKVQLNQSSHSAISQGNDVKATTITSTSTTKISATKRKTTAKKESELSGKKEAPKKATTRRPRKKPEQMDLDL